MLAATLAAAGPAAPVAPASAAEVASSTTSLTLGPSPSAYGQQVSATASVTTDAGAPAGGVAFSVDGLAIVAPVGADGVATLVLPAAHAGEHAVSATFVPTDPTAHAGSASPAQAWTVTRAATVARVPVTGRTTRVPTTVAVQATGAYGSVPTGRVGITVKRVGHRGTRSRVRALDRTGSAQVGLGRLEKGRYTVTVVVRGDADHLALRKTKAFRVTRR